MIQIWPKIRSFINQNFEKNDFSEICLKNLVGFKKIQANFWTVVQDVLKMIVPSLSQHNFRKSQEFWDF